ncbi:hypothetical protein [Mycolicibacterium moriokaense]|jgi:hypothetical protein|uniref:Uncharacterized protein n=1 Tax=Mycolicibacterium moriokaense TaxID=39691 RepID=A0AAD1M6M8_9MYCO|nr:hypothetical protein [Mycolicibacterium moriokaense]MCV7041698.1 hypothetical protein [Mycolicibacterium moriokaense]BBX01516.1 hypothetical protein MMOR_24520 [Mycolicibacterium moriokaense]
MSQIGASIGAGVGDALADDEVTAHGPVAVYNCSRIGRVANPPSSWFSELFRVGRRR